MNKPKKHNEPLTKAICNKGFSGNSSILPRSNFGVGGQDSSPQSTAVYTRDRYRSLLSNSRNENKNLLIFITNGFILYEYKI